MTTLVASVDSEWFTRKDENENLTFLMKCLKMKDVTVNFIRAILKRMTKEEVRETIIIDDVPTNALLLTMNLKLNFDIFIIVLDKCGYIDELENDTDIVRMAKSTLDPEVFTRFDDYVVYSQDNWFDEELCDFVTVHVAELLLDALQLHHIESHNVTLLSRDVIDDCIRSNVRFHDGNTDRIRHEITAETHEDLTDYIEKHARDWDLERYQETIAYGHKRMSDCFNDLRIKKYEKAECGSWEAALIKSDDVSMYLFNLWNLWVKLSDACYP
eukprot:TRINITY_DN15848_c0_g2_i1.p1 TRINITY_DN15848_c0_g2~~TRINITY_DN15848_c0_g2_i1.p1  ORF type:complete len:311 (+),score=55.92 TRINITY_DN15848_c0_g2_i1:121-933(+)